MPGPRRAKIPGETLTVTASGRGGGLPAPPPEHSGIRLIGNGGSHAGLDRTPANWTPQRASLSSPRLRQDAGARLEGRDGRGTDSERALEGRARAQSQER